MINIFCFQLIKKKIKFLRFSCLRDQAAASRKPQAPTILLSNVVIKEPTKN